MPQETPTTKKSDYKLAIPKPTWYSTAFKYIIAIALTISILSSGALYYLWQHEQTERASDRQDFNRQVQELKQETEKLQTSLLIK